MNLKKKIRDKNILNTWYTLLKFYVQPIEHVVFPLQPCFYNKYNIFLVLH